MDQAGETHTEPYSHERCATELCAGSFPSHCETCGGKNAHCPCGFLNEECQCEWDARMKARDVKDAAYEAREGL